MTRREIAARKRLLRDAIMAAEALENDYIDADTARAHRRERLAALNALCEAAAMRCCIHGDSHRQIRVAGASEEG